MNKRIIFQATFIAGLIAFAGILMQALAVFSVPHGIHLQPDIPMPIDQFVRASNDFPDKALIFFAGDSLFILGYLMLFGGLFSATVERARVFAFTAMGMGILAAMLDSTENAFYITYALESKAGFPLIHPDVLLVSVITNLKWMAAFATLLSYSLIFPRRNLFEWMISGLMFLFPIVGILGIMNPQFIAFRGLFFLVGMPVFAFYFWRRSSEANTNYNDYHT